MPAKAHIVKAMMANALTFTSCLGLSVRPSVRACPSELHTKPDFEKKNSYENIGNNKKATIINSIQKK